MSEDSTCCLCDLSLGGRKSGLADRSKFPVECFRNNSSRWHSHCRLHTQTRLIYLDAENAAILEQLKADKGRITRSTAQRYAPQVIKLPPERKRRRTEVENLQGSHASLPQESAIEPASDIEMYDLEVPTHADTLYATHGIDSDEEKGYGGPPQLPVLEEPAEPPLLDSIAHEESADMAADAEDDHVSVDDDLNDEEVILEAERNQESRTSACSRVKLASLSHSEVILRRFSSTLLRLQMRPDLLPHSVSCFTWRGRSLHACYWAI